MAKGFGKMDVGLVNQVNKVNKNYDSEILATGVNSFMSAAKPVVCLLYTSPSPRDS